MKRMYFCLNMGMAGLFVLLCQTIGELIIAS